MIGLVTSVNIQTRVIVAEMCDFVVFSYPTRLRFSYFTADTPAMFRFFVELLFNLREDSKALAAYASVKDPPPVCS